jgi:hypothetical protein
VSRLMMTVHQALEHQSASMVVLQNETYMMSFTEYNFYIPFLKVYLEKYKKFLSTYNFNQPEKD